MRLDKIKQVISGRRMKKKLQGKRNLPEHRPIRFVVQCWRPTVLYFQFSLPRWSSIVVSAPRIGSTSLGSPDHRVFRPADQYAVPQTVPEADSSSGNSLFRWSGHRPPNLPLTHLLRVYQLRVRFRCRSRNPTDVYVRSCERHLM